MSRINQGCFSFSMQGVFDFFIVLSYQKMPAEAGEISNVSAYLYFRTVVISPVLQNSLA